MTKAVIFDIDNTLYCYDDAHAAAFQAVCDYVSNQFGISADEFLSLHKDMNKKLQGRMGPVAASHNRLIRYQNILEEKGLPMHPHLLNMYDTYWNTLLEASVPSDGAVECLQWLKEKGIRIGICTDMTARMQFLKLTKYQMLPYIDFVVSSEEAGAEKPDRAMFDLALLKAGCERNECTFVGDHLVKDVQGSIAAGMHGILFSPQGIRSELDVPQIVSFRELPSLLAE